MGKQSLNSDFRLTTRGDTDYLLPKLIKAINHATEIEMAILFFSNHPIKITLENIHALWFCMPLFFSS